jgi:hypothetical protein
MLFPLGSEIDTQKISPSCKTSGCSLRIRHDECISEVDNESQVTLESSSKLLWESEKSCSKGVWKEAEINIDPTIAVNHISHLRT